HHGQVRVAQPGRLDADQQLAGAGPVELELRDRDGPRLRERTLPTDLLQHRTTNPHAATSPRRDRPSPVSAVQPATPGRSPARLPHPRCPRPSPRPTRSGGSVAAPAGPPTPPRRARPRRPPP